MNIVAVTRAESKSGWATGLYNVDLFRGRDQVGRDFLGLDCCVRCAGAASCHAAANARGNVVFLAALRLTLVPPLRPQRLLPERRPLVRRALASPALRA
jgi:hypothetical protein